MIVPKSSEIYICYDEAERSRPWLERIQIPATDVKGQNTTQEEAAVEAQTLSGITSDADVVAAPDSEPVPFPSQAFPEGNDATERRDSKTSSKDLQTNTGHHPLVTRPYSLHVL